MLLARYECLAGDDDRWVGVADHNSLNSPFKYVF